MEANSEKKTNLELLLKKQISRFETAIEKIENLGAVQDQLNSLQNNFATKDSFVLTHNRIDRLEMSVSEVNETISNSLSEINLSEYATKQDILEIQENNTSQQDQRNRLLQEMKQQLLDLKQQLLEIPTQELLSRYVKKDDITLLENKMSGIIKALEENYNRILSVYEKKYQKLEKTQYFLLGVSAAIIIYLCSLPYL